MHPETAAFKSTRPTGSGGAEQESTEYSYAASAPRNIRVPNSSRWIYTEKCTPPSPPKFL
jgi:hypothetical protein